MKGRIFIPERISPVGLQFLEERHYDILHGNGIAKEELIRDIRDCDALLLRTALIPREVLEAGNKLRIIARHGVGIDNVDLEAATALGILVSITPEANANTVSEHTMALLLALSKQLLIMDKANRNGDFGIRNRMRNIDLAGKVLGLVGLGRIGRLVAKKAVAFGMNIVFYDPYVTGLPEAAHYRQMDSLDGLLEICDFISLHSPLNASTKGLIGRRELALMKPSAYLINASRGGVVDEDALAEALRSGVIAGAALDVFEQEPPPTDHPLFSMDQVILTPHTASLTKEATDLMALHAAMEIDAVLSGGSPRWAVNKPVAPRG